MIVCQGLEDLRERLPGTVLTIGNFDGVHLGHQALFARTVERARAIGGSAVVMTFEPHPMRVLRPAVNLPLITPLPQKLKLISAAGIQLTLCMRFDEDLARLSADDFVDKLLHARLGVAEVVVGHDFTFGRKGLGDLELLREKGEGYGFAVHEVGPVLVDGRAVSSTRVRQRVRAGDMEGARNLLGRYYTITGRVMPGKGRGGRLLGFPTANLKVVDELIPLGGVYAVQVDINGQGGLPGVTNIGSNPTFDDGGLNVETHILDFDREIYGQEISVHFVKHLRSEKRFNGPEELGTQIKRDVADARLTLEAL